MDSQATNNDLMEIAKVHKICFPENFSTILGIKFSLLEKFYKEYLIKTPELFLVAENEHREIIGFCMGYYCESNTYMKDYFKHNLFSIGLRLSLLLLTGNKVAWKKLCNSKKSTEWVIKNHSFDSIMINERGDLLSICVLPEYRGAGIAQGLMDEYLTVLKKQNRKLCILSVDPRNGRGVHFYEKNGFVLYKSNGETTASYVKLLG